MHEPEALAYYPGIPKKPLDPGGFGVGDDVEILGGFADNEVAYRPPHDIGVKAKALKVGYHP
jgi:hypothetical protein